MNDMERINAYRGREKIVIIANGDLSTGWFTKYMYTFFLIYSRFLPRHSVCTDISIGVCTLERRPADRRRSLTDLAGVFGKIATF